jgi:hypothetical protein
MQSNITAKFYKYGEQEQYKHRRSQRTQHRILLEYCARRMHLALLLEKFPNLTPKEYLQIQLKSGVEAIGVIVNYLKGFTPEFIITSLLKDYNERIFATRYGKEEIIAIDEAGAAAVVLKDKMIIQIDSAEYTGMLGLLVNTFQSLPGVTSTTKFKSKY